MKLLIVDDEKSVRQGLLETIPWEEVGITKAVGARNGPDALREMQKEPADIVITDIRMPGMDGLELTWEINNNWNECHVILLSAYSEFEYAQKAISLGVEKYLLKPVDIDELLHVVKTICCRTGGNHSVKDKGQGAFDIGSLSNKDPLTDVRAMSLRLHLDSNEGVQNVANYFEKARMATERFLKPLYDVYRYDPTDNNTWSFLLIPYSERMLNATKELSGLAEQITRAINISGVNVTCALSDVYPMKDHLKAKEQSNQLLEYHFFLGSNVVITSDFLKGKTAKLSNSLDNNLTTIKHLLAKSQERETLDVIHEIFSEYRFCSVADIPMIRENCGKLMNVIIAEMNLESTSRYFCITSRNYLNTADTLDELITMVESACYAVLEHTENRVARNYVINALKEYTNENYANSETSITQAAAILNRNPNYLSHLFAQIEKCTYSEYLNKIRIEKAKDLLDTTLLASYEVADRVGFSNYRYFSQVFKNLTGYTPHQWRNRRDY